MSCTTYIDAENGRRWFVPCVSLIHLVHMFSLMIFHSAAAHLLCQSFVSPFIFMGDIHGASLFGVSIRNEIATATERKITKENK